MTTFDLGLIQGFLLSFWIQKELDRIEETLGEEGEDS